MKKYFYPLSIVFAILVLFSACKKELTGEPPRISTYLTTSNPEGADSIFLFISYVEFSSNSEDTATFGFRDTVNKRIEITKLSRENTIADLSSYSPFIRGNLGKIRLICDADKQSYWKDGIKHVIVTEATNEYLDVVVNDPIENGKIYAFDINFDMKKSIKQFSSTHYFINPVLNIKRD